MKVGPLAFSSSLLTSITFKRFKILPYQVLGGWSKVLYSNIICGVYCRSRRHAFDDPRVRQLMTFPSPSSEFRGVNLWSWCTVASDQRLDTPNGARPTMARLEGMSLRIPPSILSQIMSEDELDTFLTSRPIWYIVSSINVRIPDPP